MVIRDWDLWQRRLQKPVLHERSIANLERPPLDVQVANVMRRGTTEPLRLRAINEALSVPAVFGAVNLISNTVGMMAMRVLRSGVEIPPDDRPSVVKRPNPFRTAQAFYSRTAYHMASRGEGWWWVAARDSDDLALSLISVNPRDVVVTEDPRDLRFPRIEWKGRRMPNRDMVHIVAYQTDEDDLRGLGPLQLCGMAVSVAVEAQQWAANWYAEGGKPDTLVKAQGYLGGEGDGWDPELARTEAERFKEQWIGTYHNTVKVIDESIREVQVMQYDQQSAQMMEARDYQVGDIARAFSMPNTLLNHAVSGSSITYQNIPDQYDDFLRRCLRPNYLAPIEAAMSDLITRNTVARFDTDVLTLADPKTRYETYKIGIDGNFLQPEEARSFEGLAPGDTNNAPVPFSPPAAVPSSLPIQGRSIGGEWRCVKCKRKLATTRGLGTTIECRCGEQNVA